jgi:hypothetical protein
MISPRPIYRLLRKVVMPPEANEEIHSDGSTFVKATATIKLIIPIGFGLAWVANQNAALGLAAAIVAGALILFTAIRGMVRSRRRHLAYEADLRAERNSEVADWEGHP